MSNQEIEGSINYSGPNPRFVARARYAGLVAACIATVLVLTVPISWLLQTPILRPKLPLLTPAHLIGLCSSIFLAISVFFLYRNASLRLLKVMWWMILVSTGIVLLQFLIPGPLPFAALIRMLDPIENPDKIAPNGALCLFSSSLSALLLASSRPRALLWAQAAALVCALVAALALIGHAYTIQSLYGIRDYGQMSVAGALHHFLLAVALLCVRPDRGMTRILVTQSSAGVMSRRLYATALIVPAVLGFLTIVTSGIWEWYDISFAILLFVIASIVFFVAVVAATSLRMERADHFRLRAEGDLRASRERLRELSAYTQVMQEEERVRIAREVHDELGQSLTALKMDVAMLRKQVPAREDIERRMNSMLDLVNGTIQSVQRISSELRPSVLDDLGLAAAIEWQAREFEKRSGLHCHVQLPIYEIVTNPSQATALFRIFQETLTNVARHANATQVDVRLREEHETIQLRVRDDGIGVVDFEVTTNSSLGLMGMRERATLAGGTLDMESTPGKGMTVLVTMPKIV